MKNLALPQVETPTLAEYYGLDFESLEDHLNWESECQYDYPECMSVGQALEMAREYRKVGGKVCRSIR